MPIRPENRDRYPSDWPAVSQAIRERAGHVCEACGAPDKGMIRRGLSAEDVPVWRLASWSAYENGRSAVDGSEVPDTGEDTVGWSNPVRVVLTVAHLDHRPENCDPANLRAWCQRCHNAYDAPARRAGIRARAFAARAAGDLFREGDHV